MRASAQYEVMVQCSQSIVVASTATRWYGHEADILRFVFVHSITLAVLVGILIMILAHT
jgi:lactate permease